MFSPGLKAFPSQLLQQAFTQNYHGKAIDGIIEYLEKNNRLFSDSNLSKRYYGKFCSIVQSSGTGKSRLMIEVIPVNLSLFNSIFS